MRSSSSGLHMGYFGRGILRPRARPSVYISTFNPGRTHGVLSIELLSKGSPPTPVEVSYGESPLAMTLFHGRFAFHVWSVV